MTKAQKKDSPAEPALFGKTYDQQVMLAGTDVLARDITPNRRIPAEIGRLGSALELILYMWRRAVRWSVHGAASAS